MATTTGCKACKERNAAGWGEACERCRGIAEGERYRGMRFTCESNGARITIDPKFDVPARKGARSARHAIRGEGMASGIAREVYPWTKLIDGVMTLIEASDIVDLSAPGDEMVKLWIRERAKLIARRMLPMFRDPMWRAMRFARGMKGIAPSRDALARALRSLTMSAALALGAMARRSLTASESEGGHARREAYTRGCGRVIERLDKLARRFEALPTLPKLPAMPKLPEASDARNALAWGFDPFEAHKRVTRERDAIRARMPFASGERATLHGRYATIALSREVRAYDAAGALPPSTLAEMRETMSIELATGAEMSIASDIAARVMGDDASEGACVALSACLSKRKARGSRARNARAARALAVAEAKRIADVREGRASMLSPLATLSLAELDALLAERIAERQAQRARLAKRSARERESGEKGVIAKLNATIKAIEDERAIRNADAERDAARKRIKGWARLRAFRIARAAHAIRGISSPDTRPCLMPLAEGCKRGMIPLGLIAHAIPDRPKFIAEDPTHATMTLASSEIAAPVRPVKLRGFIAKGMKVSIKGLIWTESLKRRMRASVKRSAIIAQPRMGFGIKLKLAALKLKLSKMRIKGAKLTSAMIGAMLS